MMFKSTPLGNCKLGYPPKDHQLYRGSLFTWLFLIPFLFFALGQKLSAQPNNPCAGAFPIACGDVAIGTTAAATNDGPVTDCNSGSTAPDVWYTITGTGAAITTSLCGSGYDTQVDVYTGACGALVNIGGCNDDFCGLQSQMTWASTLGVVYRIRVHGFGGATGAYTLAVTCAPPANNACANGLPIACGGSTSGTTAIATTDGPVTDCLGGSTAPDVWYNIVGTGNDITASLCTSGYDTQLDVYTGACGALVNIGGCNDDFCGLQSQMTWASTLGVLYRIRVHGFAGATGVFNLNVICPPPPANNDCANSISISVQANSCTSQILGTNVDATPSGELPLPGCGNFASGQDVWFNITVPPSGNLVVEVTDAPGPSPQDWAMQLYSGTCGSLIPVPLGCDDDSGPGLFPLLNLTGLTPGAVLRLRVWEWGNDLEGTFNICAYDPPVCSPTIVSTNYTVELSGPAGQFAYNQIVAGIVPGFACLPGFIIFDQALAPADGDVGTSANLGGVGGGVGISLDCSRLGTHTMWVVVKGNVGSVYNLGVDSQPIQITVTVNDVANPMITCPVDIAMNAAPNTCALVVATPAPFVSDNCSFTLAYELTGATTGSGSNNVPAGQSFNVGVTTVTYTATDGSGNMETCDFTVTINDTEAPVWNDPSVAVAAALSGEIAVLYNAPNPGEGPASGRLRVFLNCNDTDYATDLAWIQAFIPDADDNCDGTIAGIFSNPGSGIAALLCTTVNGHINNYLRQRLNFRVIDASLNALNAGPPNNRFQVEIYTSDLTPPNFDGDDGPPVSVPAPGTVTEDETTAGTFVDPWTYTADMNLEVGTNDSWNPALNNAACNVDLAAVGAPSLAVTADDCQTIAYTWEITSGPRAGESGMGNSIIADLILNAFSTVFALGTHDIQYTGVDNCNQVSTYTFTLEVVDNTPPVVDCTASMASISNPYPADPNGCEATVQWEAPTTSDNCNPAPILTVEVLDINGNPMGIVVDLNAGGVPLMHDAEFPVGTWTVVYTLDDGLNTSTCDFEVTVVDDQAPILVSCGAGQMIPTICGTATVPNYTGAGVPGDNCLGSSYTITQTPLAGTLLQNIPGLVLANGNTFTVTLTISDGVNLPTSSCNITVTILDLAEIVLNQIPLGVINASTTLGADCGLLVVPAPTANDCGTTVYGIPSFSNGIAGPNLYYYSSAVGSITITWSYPGSALTQLQAIHVIDDTADPIVNAPANLALTTAPGLCSRNVNLNALMTEVLPTSTPYPHPADAPGDGEMIDNCGIVLLEYKIGAGPRIPVPITPVTFQKGVHLVTYYATDAEGNEGSDSFIITISDNEPPVVSCVANPVRNIGATGVGGDAILTDCAFTLGMSDVSLNPTATDNCPTPGSAPVRTLISLVPTVLGSGSYVAGPVANSLAGATFNVNPLLGMATFQATWSFNDGNGQIVQCIQNIMIVDTRVPAISCPVNTTRSANGNCQYVVVGTEFDPLSMSDNCSLNLATLTNSKNGMATLAGAVFNQGTTMVTWEVKDVKNNTITCTVPVIINDTTEPTLNCVNIIMPLPAAGTLVVNPSNFLLSFGDNCTPNGSITLSVVPNTFTCAQATNTPILVTITATDMAGNVAICKPTITVQENVVPVANCQSITRSLTGNQITVFASELNNGSTDNCAGTLTYWFNAACTIPSNTYTCANTGANPVIIYVKDASGNVSTPCNATITVVDATPPVAVCQALTLPLNASGNLTVNASQFNNGSTDNCGPLTYQINGFNSMNFNCSHIGVGPIPIVLKVTDGATLTHTCNTTITIVDATAPTASCQNQTVNLSALTGTATITAAQFNNGSTDACSGTNLNYTFAGGGSSMNLTCSNIGSGPVTINIQDQNGNLVQCTPTLTVLPANVVTFTAGHVSGPAGGTVDIPVTANHFFAMRSFQFSLHVVNPAVATINSIFTNIPGSLIPSASGASDRTVTWTSPTNSGETLPPGAIIFYIRVNLVGAAGTSSPVTLDGNPTPPVVSQGCGGTPYITSLNFGAPGSVSITAGSSATISGTITREGTPVSQVTVQMTGSVAGSVVTGPTGTYSFNVPNGSTVTIKPKKDINVLNGVNAADAAIINAHIANGGGIITTPYRLLAADVDLSSSMFVMDPTAADAGIIQNVIAGNLPNFSLFNNNESWRFVPSNHAFPLPANPWSTNPIPNSRTFTNVASNQVANFEGMKNGDVDAGASPASLVVGDPIIVTLENEALQAGQEYILHFGAKDFTDVLAHQFTLGFDAAKLSFVAANLADLDNTVFGLNQTVEGQIAIVWAGSEPTELLESQALFSLTFVANEDVANLEGLFSIGNQIAEAIAFRAGFDPVDVLLEVSTLTATNGVNLPGFALYQNRPNPFKAETSIGFSLPNGGEATLTVFDISGKLIYTSVNTYTRGYNEVSLQGADLPETGILYYQLTSSDGSAIRKMIMVE